MSYENLLQQIKNSHSLLQASLDYGTLRDRAWQ